MAKYYEELEKGSVWKHAVTRTVTDVDNLLFSTLTYNTQPLHLDEEYSAKTMYGTRIINSFFTLAFAGGVSVSDLTLGTTLGNLGFEEVRFPAPVRIGDTLRAETTVISKRESKSRPDTGIVVFEHVGFNQRNEVVVRARRVAMMLKRPVNEASAVV